MPEFLPVCTPLLLGNECKYVEDAVKSGWISSSGSYVKAFEDAFARYCGVKHGISVCNGTLALHLALVALGVGKGDEVIVPDFTMIASAFAVCYTGAMPVFVDADEKTWNIDVRKIEEKITSKTRAIMPVHIFGNPCDMNEIHKIATKHNLVIVEDAAEAHGATYKGKKTGNLSQIAGFSFFANKNITTGEGGMVVTNDDDLADKCRYHKNVCFPINGPRNYMHDDIGFNYRMSNIHAAIGLAQTERAEEYRNLRIEHGKMYYERLENIKGLQLQKIQENGESVFWMNGIVITDEYGKSRDKLINYLKEDGIDTRLFFNGMHRQKALQKYGCNCSGEYQISDFLADNGFYLPSGSNLTEKDIDRVCKKIAAYRG